MIRTHNTQVLDFYTTKLVLPKMLIITKLEQISG